MNVRCNIHIYIYILRAEKMLIPKLQHSESDHNVDSPLNVEGAARRRCHGKAEPHTSGTKTLKDDFHLTALFSPRFCLWNNFFPGVVYRYIVVVHFPCTFFVTLLWSASSTQWSDSGDRFRIRRLWQLYCILRIARTDKITNSGRHNIEPGRMRSTSRPHTEHWFRMFR